MRDDLPQYWALHSGEEPWWPTCEYDDVTHWLDHLYHPEIYGEFGRCDETVD